MKRLNGLVAATYTPLDATGELNPAMIGPLVDHLIGQGIGGLYVCGSTGEGMSLSTSERQAITEAYVAAAAQRVPVIVQVGHNSLAEAATLAGVSPDQAIADITNTRLRALALGFAPGQPYLGFMDEHWNIPRQTEVTPEVPRGAVVVAVDRIRRPLAQEPTPPAATEPASPATASAGGATSSCAT